MSQTMPAGITTGDNRVLYGGGPAAARMKARQHLRFLSRSCSSRPPLSTHSTDTTASGVLPWVARLGDVSSSWLSKSKLFAGDTPIRP